jgi:two-component system chemotaxis response regulator CheY
VIADWMMPGIDGVSLCRRIRSSDVSGYIYFILLTGKDKKEDIIAGLDAGADDYVIKPFERGELKVRVRAGERILELERELNEQNETLNNLNIKLEELIRLDPLMDIGNRRHFYETVEKVHHQARRYGTGYGIIMCDIDNFKAFNDIYGHLGGDGILRTVADAIRRAVRVSDHVFRYGGEEIVIVLPKQDMENTILVAEKIRGNIEALDIQHKGTKGGVLTISCGAAVFEGGNPDLKWEAVLDLADRALYEAKSLGRNRVCFR